MKIMIAYPPFDDIKGTILLSQNRQYQVFHSPTYIYPVVPAQAASLLSKNGYEVVWADGIAEKWTFKEFLDVVKKEKPDLILMETKTPVVKRHWKIIENLKSQISNLKVVLCGDHATALPEESMEKSKVDFILTGGDYDFLLLNLVNSLNPKRLTLNPNKLEPGIWYRKTQISNLKSQICNTGPFVLNHDLNSLPNIDRDLTKWKLYAYENGNYKYLPGTYVMSGRDCWHRKNGGCTFCSWTTIFPTWRVRKVENVLDEIGKLIEKYKVKEIMDDTGTFPVGKWLRDFSKGMIERGYNKKISFDCNMRAGILTQEDYDLMAKAGFRFLLYGLESANQKTLEKINKGVSSGAIIKDLEMAKLANKNEDGHLEPHVTCMVGYPWESKKEAEKTIFLTRKLFTDGLIDSLQATIVIPYPGTQLFKECDQKNLLLTKDWDRYDMKEPVMKTEMKNEEVLELTRGLYKTILTPRFIFRKIKSLKGFEDLKFLLRGSFKVLGHFLDFKRR